MYVCNLIQLFFIVLHRLYITYIRKDNNLCKKLKIWKNLYASEKIYNHVNPSKGKLENNIKLKIKISFQMLTWFISHGFHNGRRKFLLQTLYTETVLTCKKL